MTGLSHRESGHLIRCLNVIRIIMPGHSTAYRFNLQPHQQLLAAGKNERIFLMSDCECIHHCFLDCQCNFLLMPLPSASLQYVGACSMLYECDPSNHDHLLAIKLY